MNPEKKLILRLETELKFAEQFGQLNNVRWQEERNNPQYWDGRVDGTWLMLDIVKRWLKEHGTEVKDG